mgnify:CR=1 FL=1
MHDFLTRQVMVLLKVLLKSILRETDNLAILRKKLSNLQKHLNLKNIPGNKTKSHFLSKTVI